LEGAGGGTRKAQTFNFIPNAKIVKEPDFLLKVIFKTQFQGFISNQ